MNRQNLPLSQIKVIELEGLAPTVMCGLVLTDFGADVIIVNRPQALILNFLTSENIV